MKIALTLAALLVLAACGDKQETISLKGNVGETVTITRTAPDMAMVADLKANPGKLKQAIDRCGKTDSKECASARRARTELMFTKPTDKPQKFQHFSGGSRDIQTP